ncbi:hypothetical protein [Arthrobacter sp. HY1533]|uniref:hypothetical protein n=1 Tax=Arthrobacter sp. HY1533 TaxID=2970919 RepID=UPI0022BA0381|nr:hypothetical protein [Arthrobacter sp. HY1533]
MEAVQFRDAEAVVRTYLLNYMGAVAMGTKLPETLPAQFLKVVRTGGTNETLISDRAQITLEAYATKEVDAVALLSTARAWLNAADGMIFGVTELSGPVNLPDPITSNIRYTMTLWVRIRGVVITG